MTTKQKAEFQARLEALPYETVVEMADKAWRKAWKRGDEDRYTILRNEVSCRRPR